MSLKPTTAPNAFKPYVFFVGCCLCIVAFQIALHYLMLKDGTGFGTLLAFHTSKAGNGKGNSDFLDIILPSALFGIAAAVAGRNWPLKKVFLALCIGSVGLVLLLPIYASIVGETLSWWWPKTSGVATLYVLTEIPKVLLVSGFFFAWFRFLFLKREKPSISS